MRARRRQLQRIPGEPRLEMGAAGAHARRPLEADGRARAGGLAGQGSVADGFDPAIIDNHAPDPALRAPRIPRGARTTAGVTASILVHAGALAAAWLWVAAPPELERGGETVIPVELLITGPSEHDQQPARAPDAAVETRQAEADLSPEERRQETVKLEEPPVAALPQAMPQPDGPSKAAGPVETALAPSGPASAMTADPAPVDVRPEPVIEPSPPHDAVAAPEPAAPTVAASRAPILPRPIPVTAPQPKPAPARSVANPPPQPRRAASAAPTPGDRPSPARAAAQRGGADGAGQTAGAGEITSWRSRVLAHLARHKIYPDWARDQGVEGRASVGFTLTRGGQVASVALAGSSGSMILDQATLAMVRRAAPFPPMPDGGPASMSFTAAIRYDLR
jgi:protein TonB